MFSKNLAKSMKVCSCIIPDLTFVGTERRAGKFQ